MATLTTTYGFLATLTVWFHETLIGLATEVVAGVALDAASKTTWAMAGAALRSAKATGTMNDRAKRIDCLIPGLLCVTAPLRGKRWERNAREPCPGSRVT